MTTNRPLFSAVEPTLVWGNEESLTSTVLRASDGLAAEPGAYLTLATVSDKRQEAQLGRRECGPEAELVSWILDLSRRALGDAHSARLRLRLWGSGGRPEGSASFRVSIPGEPAPASVDPLAPTAVLIARIEALTAELAEVKERMSRLEVGLGGMRRAQGLVLARLDKLEGKAEIAS